MYHRYCCSPFNSLWSLAYFHFQDLGRTYTFSDSKCIGELVRDLSCGVGLYGVGTIFDSPAIISWMYMSIWEIGIEESNGELMKNSFKMSLSNLRSVELKNALVKGFVPLMHLFGKIHPHIKVQKTSTILLLIRLDVSVMIILKVNRAVI